MNPTAIELLRKIEIFSLLSEEQCGAIADLFQAATVRAGQVVSRSGEYWGEMTIILNGKVRLVDDRVPEKPYTVDVLSDGACFGESMLFEERAAEFSVLSLTDVVLLRLSKASLDGLRKQVSGLDELLLYLLAHRSVRNLAVTAPVFAHLSIDQLNLLVRSMVRQDLAAGEVALKEGEMPSGLYLVETGRLRMQSRTGAVKTLGFAGRGDLVGEKALLEQRAFDYSAVAEAPTTLYFIHRAVVLAMLSDEAAVLSTPDDTPGTSTEMPAAATAPPQKVVQPMRAGGTAGPHHRHRLLDRFRPYLRPYRFLLLEVALASLSIQLLNLLLPLFAKFAIDEVIGKQDDRWLTFLLAGAAAGMVLHFAATACRQHLLLFLSWRMNLLLTRDFWKQVLSLPVGFFQHRPVGDLINRFEESNRLAKFFTQTSVGFLIDLVTALLYVTLMLYYSVSLTLVSAVFLALHFLNLYLLTPRLQRGYAEATRRWSACESLLIESLAGLRTIKALAIEFLFRWRLQNLTIAQGNASLRTERLGIAVHLAGVALQAAGTLAVLFLGARLVIDNQMTLGQLVAFTILVQSLSAPIAKAVSAWDVFQESLNAVRSLEEVFNAEAEVPRLPRLPAEPTRKPLQGRVRFEEVVFRYDPHGRNILEGVSLDILPGQRVAIVGRSGSGKSTLMKLLLGFYPVNSGRILLDEKEAGDVEWPSVRRSSGVVLQDTWLFQDTIRANIAQCRPEASLAEVIAASRQAGAHDFISGLPAGYETVLRSEATNLSGGQRQRIALARAILSDPRIIILDEATSALDEESERLFFHNLDASFRDRTLIIVSQRISTARNADMIVVLDGGRVAETGTHEQLLARKGLYRLLATRQANL